jgi:nitrogenase molybdenum-iron protein alpha/beta subunit
MDPSVPRRPGSVNLLGLSIGQARWEDDAAELRRLLAALGVEVNAVLTAGATLDEVERAPAADLNVVVQPEYGAAPAREMRRAFGQPFVGADGYVPIGPTATEAWLRAVAGALELSAERVEAALALEAAVLRRRAVPAIAALDRVRSLKGRTAAVFGEAAPAVALAGFLADYLGLEVELLGLKSAGPVAEAQVQRLQADILPIARVLWEPDLAATRDALVGARPDLVFGSSYERAAALDAGLPAERCVDFGYPLWHRVVLSERPWLGYRGALALIEDVLNAAP